MTLYGYSVWTIGVVVVLTVAVAIAGALCTEIGPWYRELKKPSWQPPDWLFGPVWTTIFILVAYAAIDSYSNATGGAKLAVVAVFILNGFFNIMWSVLFFKLKSPMMALYEVVLLWLSIVSIMIVVSPYSPISVWLMLPYLTWVSIAAYLTYTIVKLNAPGSNVGSGNA